MKSRLKKMAISFILMIIFYFLFYPEFFWKLGILTPHVGLIFVLGLLLGPYGALGAMFANIILDLFNEFTPMEIIPSAIFTFGVSCLAYKLWYSGFKTDKITKPVLDNIYHLSLFLTIISVCGLIYSAIHGNFMGFIIGTDTDEFYFISYFMNFTNIAFIFGILGIWLSKKIDFIETPKMSERKINNKLYQTIFSLLMIVTIITSITLILDIDRNIVIGEIILMGILLFGYLTKPFKYEIQETDKNSIIEKIIRNFLIITLAIAIFGILISILSFNFITHLNDANVYLAIMPTLIISDAVILLFIIPGIIILRYIENKVLKPISSFSEIEGFLKENEKIESEGLVEVYSKYINEKTEIGTLARSYTDLINHNNHYIENIHKIEGEKERINAELDIATRIQAASLPTEAIETDDIIIDGYSHPAKEVGGDFFDYYMIDDNNLALVIGDASGKGVPAALIAMITQQIIEQILIHDKNPSKVLYQLNNHLCKNNPESMFLTLWLGIYNIPSKKLIFSNAGHNPPIIKENNKFNYLNIESGIVLGVMNDFEYINEEITLSNELVIYTDGITDANNEQGKMYGEDRLLKFFNEFEGDGDPITPLLNDISSFCKNTEQFDDITLVYLKLKNIE